MSKVICPECGKIISSFAEQCPTCGFPMNSFLKEHKLNDFDKTWVCPRCGELCIFTTDKRPICEYCDTIMIQCEETNKEAINSTFAKPKEVSKQYEISLAKKYGEDQFSEEAYNHRMDELRKWREEYDRKEQSHQTTQQQSSSVACPYCKSTNTKKISAVSRAGSIGLFGIFSKKVGKQWHCNDCDSDF